MNLLCIINFPEDLEKTQRIFVNIEKGAYDNNIEIKFEICGLKNEENQLTNKDIEKADGIILISDALYPKERFGEKQIFEVISTEADKAGDKIIKSIKDLIENKNNKGEEKVIEQRKGIYRHLLSGVEAIMPLILVGGFFTFISYFFGLEAKDSNTFGGAIESLGSTAFAFVVPILSAFIAFSIADRAGFISGLIGGAFASVIGTGFLGGIIIGLLAGYITKGLIRIIRLPQSWAGFKVSFLIPVITILITGLLLIYLINPFVKWLYDINTNWIMVLGQGNMALLGAIIGILVAFDIGGVFSKTAVGSAIALFGAGLTIPQAAAFAAAMVPPLGLALAAVIARNKFSEDEIEAGKGAWLLGICGLTEGAIPFAAADPLHVIPCMMAGSAITGALVGLFGWIVKSAIGGVFALFLGGTIVSLIGICIAVIIGAVVTAYLVKYLK